MDGILQVLGVDTANQLDLASRLSLAVQGFFILFFIISPIMGYFMARQIASRVNWVLAWGVGALIVLVGGVGLTYVLRQIIPTDVLPDVAIMAISMLASTALAILVARWLVWWLAEPGEPGWVQRFRQEVAEDAQEKARERIRQRAQNSIFKR